MSRQVYRSQVLLSQCGTQFSPQLRRATALMKMVVELMEEFCKTESDFFDEEASLIFCTRHGELEPTTDFLKNYGNKGVARPFLFQNSLHHSTLGFISQHFQLLGPAYTICHQSDPLPRAKELADTLIAGGAQTVVILHADHMPEFMGQAIGESQESQATLLVVKS